MTYIIARTTFALLFLHLCTATTTLSAGALSSSATSTTRDDIFTQETHVSKATTTPEAEGPKQEQKEGDHQPGAEKEDRIKYTARIVEEMHDAISRRILTSAAWLDTFFCNERSLAEENRSSIAVRYDFFLEEKSGIASDPRVRMRIVLPQLQKRTHLVFATDPSPQPPAAASTQENATGSRVSSNIPQTVATDQSNVTTALQYFLHATPEQNFSVRTGLQFHSMRPVLYGAPRYRFFVPYERWAFRFTQELVYRTDTAWQEETRVDLERTLPYLLFFRTTIDGIWLDNKHGYFYSLNMALSRPFGANNAVSFEWTNNFQTRPGQLTETALRLRYRHTFWREWLFFEIAPQIRFPRDRNLQITPGILFSIETFFGRLPWL